MRFRFLPALFAFELLLGPCHHTAFGQADPVIPRPVERRPIQGPGSVRPEVEAYRRLPNTGSFRDRIAARQAFVDQFPGAQLSLRVMQDMAQLFLLMEKPGESILLPEYARWLEARLGSPEYGWEWYRTSSDSVLLERIEVQLAYARILSFTKNGYDRALSALAEALVEGQSRPSLWSNRPDLKEQIDFARCWCFHGKGDYGVAAQAYQRFVEDYPTSDYIPAALRNAVVCLRNHSPELGAEIMARYITRLQEEYPRSAEAADRDIAKIAQSLGLQ
ncbi:MAG: hypothetical protein HUU16_07010 [Candidatus Omnitrophica bacterium]|nr:hypothetical protein [bacterium]NUN95906.1 hypothetical protein [Candidatus Omnitrophota bacterium]